MDIAKLAMQLNSNDIKDLNRYHILSVFYQNEWHINKDDIDAPVLSQYIENNLENIILSTSERKWLFFTETTYTVSRKAHSEWEKLIAKVDYTEECIESVVHSDQKNSKVLIETVIKKYWSSVAFFVIARDIVKGRFDISDIGTFNTAMRIHETYSRRSLKLLSNSVLRGRYNIKRYYHEHADNFWCDFLILDLITDKQIDLNFIDESGIYDDYSFINEINETEIDEQTTTQDSEYGLESIQDIEDDEINMVSISSEIEKSYEPTINIDVEVQSEPESESMRSYSSYESDSNDTGSDYGSDDD